MVLKARSALINPPVGGLFYIQIICQIQISSLNSHNN